ncbi:hypothetical protein FRB91_011507 [Serendipita sp. 411]|nr:hypothetical protein FRC15_004982 [Serendipita sp. 397]KAG8775798.1 hypothetical protein FRC16_004728 [Serendipita sp. 398]KAG8807166.1 hypothetical protein FRC18_005693 [Serendipita sp. 400]KAG8810529.1 hypothetical protein FRC19_004458 [Serendipita sp. 401]KAG8841658.1 hypothetical protein FRC20_004895 [Serendipita sp. 405]KAG8857281.1 hypothetical protein FRB91_011507 [Serendipita sp. 411]KAG9035311.1 hypothetical protein FS842_003725 [Serendipita sp. 407]
MRSLISLITPVLGLFLAARAVPVSPTTHRGIIQVSTKEQGFLGYISNDLYRGIATWTQIEETAAIFTFEAPIGTTSVTRAEFTSATPLGGYPFLGLIQGWLSEDSDIGPGSYNYLFLGGTPHSDPGSTPQIGANSWTLNARTYESSVWNIDVASGNVTPQWINTNGSEPTTTLSLWYNADLFAEGDFTAASTHFTSNAEPMELKFLLRP